MSTRPTWDDAPDCILYPLTVLMLLVWWAQVQLTSLCDRWRSP